MSIEINGKFVKTLPETSGTSAKGEWRKGGFVVETEEQYPKKVAVICWGEDRLKDIAPLKDGDKVKVSVDIESREWQDKWFTDVRAWKIERVSDQASEPSVTPAAPVSATASPDVNSESFGKYSSSNVEADDDLPF